MPLCLPDPPLLQPNLLPVQFAPPPYLHPHPLDTIHRFNHLVVQTDSQYHRCTCTSLINYARLVSSHACLPCKGTFIVVESPV